MKLPSGLYEFSRVTFGKQDLGLKALGHELGRGRLGAALLLLVLRLEHLIARAGVAARLLNDGNERHHRALGGKKSLYRVQRDA